MNHRISVFTCEGQFVGADVERLDPCGLTLDNCGVVYVCDKDN